jgi:hypothetical protein
MTIDVLINTQSELGRALASAELSLDLVWGVKGIAATIGLTERQTTHLLDADLLPAKKVGRRWYSSKSSLRRHFAIEAA